MHQHHSLTIKHVFRPLLGNVAYKSIPSAFRERSVNNIASEIMQIRIHVSLKRILCKYAWIHYSTIPSCVLVKNKCCNVFVTFNSFKKFQGHWQIFTFSPFLSILFILSLSFFIALSLLHKWCRQGNCDIGTNLSMNVLLNKLILIKKKRGSLSEKEGRSEQEMFLIKLSRWLCWTFIIYIYF